MKKNKNFTLLLLALTCVWVFALMGAWDKAKPSSATSLRDSNPEMLANQTALETAIGQDHEFSTGGTNSGEHTQIKFNAPISKPTNAANKGWVYSKDVGSVVELHWLDESGNEVQLTSGGAFREIVTAEIADDAITNDKLNNMTRGTVKTGGASNAPTDLDAKTDGQILVGDGTDIASVAISGDISLTNAGVTAIVKAGSVVQVVNTIVSAVNSSAVTTPLYDDSIPQNTEGFELMTLAITPASTTNKLKIEIVVHLNHSAQATVQVALFQDSTANALAAVSSLCLADDSLTITFTHFMAAGTTSSTTFKGRAGASSGTLT